MGNAPDARILRWGYQHVGIQQPTQPDAKPNICVLPDAKPKRKPVEYRLHWVPGVGHVHFIFFVLISFALGSRRKRSFQWNNGFTHFSIKMNEIFRICTEGIDAGKHFSDFFYLSPSSNFMTKNGKI